MGDVGTAVDLKGGQVIAFADSILFGIAGCEKKESEQVENKQVADQKNLFALKLHFSTTAQNFPTKCVWQALQLNDNGNFLTLRALWL